MVPRSLGEHLEKEQSPGRHRLDGPDLKPEGFLRAGQCGKGVKHADIPESDPVGMRLIPTAGRDPPRLDDGGILDEGRQTALRLGFGPSSLRGVATERSLHHVAGVGPRQAQPIGTGATLSEENLGGNVAQASAVEVRIGGGTARGPSRQQRVDEIAEEGRRGAGDGDMLQAYRCIADAGIRRDEWIGKQRRIALPDDAAESVTRSEHRQEASCHPRRLGVGRSFEELLHEGLSLGLRPGHDPVGAIDRGGAMFTDQWQWCAAHREALEDARTTGDDHARVVHPS